MSIPSISIPSISISRLLGQASAVGHGKFYSRRETHYVSILSLYNKFLIFLVYSYYMISIFLVFLVYS